MKEIKFRAWDIESPAMLTWEEIQDDWETEGYSDNILRGDHYIPMQYAGLKDKNGKEIYEGDIIQYVVPFEGGQYTIYILVKWGKVEFSFLKKTLSNKIHRTTYQGLERYGKVIGNIYENPSLWEEVRTNREVIE